MKSAVITSGEHWLTINTIAYLRGSITPIEPVTYKDGSQGVKISSSINPLVIAVDGTTIDGDSIGSQTALISFLRDFAYANGGGSGGGGATEQWVEDNFVRKDGIFVQNGNKTALAGDSNTEDAGASEQSTGDLANQYNTNGYFTWFNALSEQAWGDPLNTGVGGETSTQIRNRFERIIEWMPNYVFIMAGTNDPILTIGSQPIIDNLKHMYDRAIENRITVIAMSIYPTRDGRDADHQELINQVNRWIKQYASVNPNIHFVDNDVPLWGKPDGFRDNVHLNPTGAYRVGVNMMKVLKDIIPDPIVMPQFNDTAVVTNNPYMNGTPVSVSDAYIQGTLPTGYQRDGGTGNERVMNVSALKNNIGESYLRIQAVTTINPSVTKNVRLQAQSSVTTAFNGYSLMKFRIIENNIDIVSAILFQTNTPEGRVFGGLPFVNEPTPWMVFKTPTRPQANGSSRFATTNIPSGDPTELKRTIEVSSIAKIRLS